MRPAKYSLRRTRAEEAVRLHDAGMPWTEVGPAVGLPPPPIGDAKRRSDYVACVQTAIRRAGVAVPSASRGRPPKQDAEEGPDYPPYRCARCGKVVVPGGWEKRLPVRIGGANWCQECAEKRFRRQIRRPANGSDAP